MKWIALIFAFLLTALVYFGLEALTSLNDQQPLEPWKMISIGFISSAILFWPAFKAKDPNLKKIFTYQKRSVSKRITGLNWLEDDFPNALRDVGFKIKKLTSQKIILEYKSGIFQVNRFEIYQINEAIVLKSRPKYFAGLFDNGENYRQVNRLEQILKNKLAQR